MHKRTGFLFGWITLIVFMSIGMVQGKSIYIAQTAQGSGNGTSPANAHAAAWFNTAANWGAGAGNISPGDTVHLCGTITTALSFKSGGSAGNPIVLFFETGAKMSNTTFSAFGIELGNYYADPGAIIDLNGHSFIIIDGGTDGAIENTDNGSALGHQEECSAIDALYGSNIEIRNLTMQNIYVHRYDDTYKDDTSAGPNGISLRDGNNIYIHDCTLHDMCWAITMAFSVTAVDNLEISRCDIYNVDHGIAVGGWSATSTTISSVCLTGNHIHDYANWDTDSDRYHHDGIHVYTSSPAAATIVAGLVIAGNTFDGNMGNCVTAHVYLEGETASGVISNALVYNNVFTGGYGVWAGGLAEFSETIANNTFLNAAIRFCGGDHVIKNNIIDNGGKYAPAYHPFRTVDIDYNLYSGNQEDTFYAAYVDNVYSDGNFAAWKTYIGGGVQESHSIFADPLLNGDGTLPPGSPAINAGEDLSSLFTTDLTGTSRPQGSAWDIGAYEYKELSIVPAERDGFAIDPAPLPLLPNPIRAALFARYLQGRKDVRIHDLAGKMIGRNGIRQNAMYLLDVPGNQAVQKMIVLP